MGRRPSSDLPFKVCPVCNRPFEWRKKWADDWEHVKYCSERCRRNKHRDEVPWAASPNEQ